MDPHLILWSSPRSGRIVSRVESEDLFCSRKTGPNVRDYSDTLALLVGSNISNIFDFELYHHGDEILDKQLQQNRSLSKEFFNEEVG